MNAPPYTRGGKPRSWAVSGEALWRIETHGHDGVPSHSRKGFPR
jgi:hypothetical protein